MFNCKIPTYVITQFTSSKKDTFLSQLLSSRREKKILILLVDFEEEVYKRDLRDNFTIVSMQKNNLDTYTAKHISSYLLSNISIHNPDEIWLEWNSKTNINILFKALEISKKCRIKRTIQLVNCNNYLTLLNEQEKLLLPQLLLSNIIILQDYNIATFKKTKNFIRNIDKNISIYKDTMYSQIYDCIFYKKFNYLNRLVVLVATFLFFIIFLNSFNISLNKFSIVFISTWLQAVPFLLIGVILSSFIELYIRDYFFQKLFSKNNFLSLFISIFSGFFLPICDCTSIPLFKSLIKKGVPVRYAIMFMLSCPSINPVVILSTYYAYNCNIKYVFIRISFGIICSLLIGLSFYKFNGEILKDSGYIIPCACNSCIHEKSKHIHINSLINHIKNEFFGIVNYLLIGIGISTTFQLIIKPHINNLPPFSNAISIIIMMCFAFILSLCSSSDAIISKSLISNSSLAATLGFLILGPMIDIKNILLMSNNFSKKFIIRLTITIFLICFLVIYIASLLGLEVFSYEI